MDEEKPEVETYAVALKVDTPPGSAAAVTYGVAVPAGRNATTSSSGVPPMWQQEKVDAKCCMMLTLSACCIQ